MAEASGTQSLDEPFDFDPVLLALRAWEWVGTVPPPPLPKNWKMPYDFDLANYLALNSPRTGDLVRHSNYFQHIYTWMLMG